MSPSIELEITREGDDYSTDLTVLVEYEPDGDNLYVRHFGEPINGGAPIKLTDAEWDRAQEAAWEDWGQEQFA